MSQSVSQLHIHHVAKLALDEIASQTCLPSHMGTSLHLQMTRNTHAHKEIVYSRHYLTVTGYNTHTGTDMMIRTSPPHLQEQNVHEK